MGEFGEEMMRRSVLAAEVLGVKWMVVHPVNILTDGHNDPEASFRYNLEYYGKWAEFFRTHHVGMAIENMLCGGRHNNVWADIDRLCALVDAIGRDNVGVCVDTGHANIPPATRPPTPSGRWAIGSVLPTSMTTMPTAWTNTWPPTWAPSIGAT